MLVTLLIGEARLAEARPLAESLAAVPGWQARGWLLRARIDEALSDSAAAAQAYEAASRSDLAQAGISPAELRIRLARALLRAGRFADAGKLLALPGQTWSSATPQPADAETAWLLSRALLQQGDRPGAAEMLKRAADFPTHALDLEPAPFAGAATCAECHSAIYGKQQSSHHASTFLIGKLLQSVPPTNQPMADPYEPRVTFEVAQSEEGPRLVTRSGGQTSSAVGKYGFGSGDRGLTLVGQDSAGALREFRVSLYGDHQGWDLTTGHPRVPSEAAANSRTANPADYLGEKLAEDEVRRCFQCHTTDARSAHLRIEPAMSDHAIGCERCHGPAGTHIVAMKAAPAFSDMAIARPRLATPAETVGLCGRCHSPPGREVSRRDPNSIRFQATTLTWSRCFSQSQGEFGCVTCHNPHSDAETDPAYYVNKCLTCHSSPGTDRPPHAPSDGARPIEVPATLKRTICPVNPTDGCIDCHMPKRQNLVPHTIFTDHFIRADSPVPSNNRAAAVR